MFQFLKESDDCLAVATSSTLDSYLWSGEQRTGDYHPVLVSSLSPRPFLENRFHWRATDTITVSLVTLLYLARLIIAVSREVLTALIRTGVIY